MPGLHRSLSFLLAIACLASSACGVKGPPLPPLAVTPQESDEPEAEASDVPGRERKRLPTDGR